MGTARDAGYLVHTPSLPSNGAFRQGHFCIHYRKGMSAKQYTIPMRVDKRRIVCRCSGNNILSRGKLPAVFAGRKAVYPLKGAAEGGVGQIAHLFSDGDDGAFSLLDVFCGGLKAEDLQQLDEAGMLQFPAGAADLRRGDAQSLRGGLQRGVR